MKVCLIERSDLRSYDAAAAAEVVHDVSTAEVRACNEDSIAQNSVFESRCIVVDECLTAAFLRDLLDNCSRIQVKSAALSAVVSLEFRELICIESDAQ